MDYPKMPECDGFVLLDGKPAWVNSKDEAPVGIEKIVDKLTFSNCCNTAIIWWTEKSVEMTNSYELMLHPDTEEGRKLKQELSAVRGVVRAWRRYKKGRLDDL